MKTLSLAGFFRLILIMSMLVTTANAQSTGCPPNPSVAHPDTVEILLQPYQIIDYTHITVQWNPVTQIWDTMLVIPGACAVFKNHLRIPINDTTGVQLSPSGGNMRIPGYYYIRVNGCVITAYDDKEDFYLVSGLQYPYEFRGGKLDNILKRGAYDYNAAEWIWLKNLGQPSAYTMWSAADTAYVPDTMMWYTYDTVLARYVPIEPMGCDDPWSNGVVGVTMTYTDRYSSNEFVINGIGDGVFPLTVAINLPATQYDPGMYPNFYEHNFRKTGTHFEWTDDPLPDCCPEDQPPAAPGKVQIIGNRTLKWDATANTEEYYVYARMAHTLPGNSNKVIGWHEWQEVTETELTEIPFPALPGIWQYGVSSENCAGESDITISRKDQ